MPLPQYVIVRYVHCNQANDGHPKQFPLNTLLIAILFLPCMLLSNHLTHRLWVSTSRVYFREKCKNCIALFSYFLIYSYIFHRKVNKSSVFNFPFHFVIAFNSKITNESSINPIIDWVPFYKHTLIKVVTCIRNCFHRFIWGVILATLS